MTDHSRRRTRVGLWVRMLVASAILLASLLVLLVLEFLVVLLLAGAAFGLVLVVVQSVLEPVPVLAFVVAVGCYLAVLVVGYHAVRVARSEDREYELELEPDAAAGMGATVAVIRRQVDRSTVAVALVVVFVVAVVAHLFAAVTAGGLLVLAVPAVVSALVVGSQFVHTVRSELSGDVAVLRTLEETVHLSDDLERDPELASIRRRTDRLARQAGVPTPAVRIAVTRTPTAMTVGYRPTASTIVLSRGLVTELDERELEAVLAHELAHVANRDAAVMSALSIPAAKAEAFLERYDGAGYLGLLALCLQGLSQWCVVTVARYREYVADDGAVAITGDPAALASALETLDRSVARRPTGDLRGHRTAAAFSIVPPPWEEWPFLDRLGRFAVRGLFGTHPPTEKRIQRLRSRVGDS